MKADARRQYLTTRLGPVIWSSVAVAAAYLGLSLWTGWTSVATSFERIGVVPIVTVLLLSLTNYGLRFARWQIYLTRQGQRVPVVQSGRIYVAGFALTATPGKAGEAMRGVLLRPWSVPYAASFGALISERMSDLWAIILLALLGAAEYPAARFVLELAAVGIPAIMLSLSAPGLIEWVGRRGTGRLRKIIGGTANALLEARRCQTASLLVAATALACLAWAAEAYSLKLLLLSLGFDRSFSFAAFVYGAGILAGALTMLPGGVGGAEAVMLALLLTDGVPRADGLAAVLAIRLCTLWFAVFLGVVSLVGLRPGATRNEAHA